MENNEIEQIDNQRDDCLIWIDLESTGLDIDNQMSGVKNHKILEVGIHITDSDFNIIDEGLEIIIHHEEEDLNLVMNDYVKNMHQKNGLLDKVKASSISLAQAEQMMIEYVKSYNIKEKSSPICGNNVSFDKNFIDAQMPLFAKVLHYRKIDVSSLKEIISRQYPEVSKLVQKVGSHRALDDIKESIKELILYQNHVFVPRERKTDKLKLKT